MTERQAVAVFGSTGSIGNSTLDVVKRNRQQYELRAITAHSNVDKIAAQCIEFEPRYAAMAEPAAGAELKRRLSERGVKTTVLPDDDAFEQLAEDPEIPIVMAAIVGFAGLDSTLTAARAGKRILLANKESMVVAGHLLNRAAKQGNATIVPVDSEHNAIFQCLPQANQLGAPVGGEREIERLVLTASGGPFRTLSSEEMANVTVEQAISHPNWSMGPKISVDSATMMNKGLEVIEACFLFGVEEQQIEVLVHPQSVVHSMVRYCDGSVLAQLGESDMRTPIANALAWPQRIDAGVSPLDFKALAGLQFEAPDNDRFPCLDLARKAMRTGRGANVVLNAANEVAVQWFIDGQIRFVDIAAVNSYTLAHCESSEPYSVADLKALDQAARSFAEEIMTNGQLSVGLA